MKFYYELHEPELMQACFDLELRQAIEEAWRESRKRASLALLLLVPLLTGLLAASFHYLSTRQVRGYWDVLVVSLLGALLGGALVSLRRLTPLVRTRIEPPLYVGALPWSQLVFPLLSAAGAGFLSTFLVTSRFGADAYRPQTVYLIGLFASLVWLRLLPAPAYAPAIRVEQ